MSIAIQDRYPDDFAHCFGCGRMNPHGHQLKSYWQGGEVVARFTPRREQVALPGFVYGGLLASLIDCHGMATAAAFAERAEGGEPGDRPAPRYVTAALNVQYLKPTPVGREFVLRGRVTESSARKSRVAVTLEAGGDVTVKGEVIAVPVPASMIAASIGRGEGA